MGHKYVHITISYSRRIIMYLYKCDPQLTLRPLTYLYLVQTLDLSLQVPQLFFFLSELCTKNEQNRVRKSTVFSKFFIFSHFFSVGRVSTIAGPSEMHIEFQKNAAIVFRLFCSKFQCLTREKSQSATNQVNFVGRGLHMEVPSKHAC